MTLSTDIRTLLTVITEATIETSLIRDFERLGVRDYTISDARGRGSHGVSDAAWNETANIRIELICAREQAELLLQHIQQRPHHDFAMVAFLHQVEILRPAKL